MREKKISKSHALVSKEKEIKHSLENIEQKNNLLSSITCDFNQHMKIKGWKNIPYLRAMDVVLGVTYLHKQLANVILLSKIQKFVLFVHCYY